MTQTESLLSQILEETRKKGKFKRAVNRFSVPNISYSAQGVVADNLMFSTGVQTGYLVSLSLNFETPVNLAPINIEPTIYIFSGSSIRGTVGQAFTLSYLDKNNLIAKIDLPITETIAPNNTTERLTFTSLVNLRVPLFVPTENLFCVVTTKNAITFTVQRNFFLEMVIDAN